MPSWYAWKPNNHLLEFFGIRAVLFWQDPSLVTILRPLIEELGEAYYYLLVAFEANEGTDDDYHRMVMNLGDTFHEGLQRWGDAVATAGWGQLRVHRVDPDAAVGKVSIVNPWELTVFRADEVEYNLPFLTGKLSGIFTLAFGRTMRARVVDIRESVDRSEAVIEVRASDATLLSELEELMRRDGFSRHERLQFANRQLRERTQELARVNALLTIARDEADNLRRIAEEANAAKSRLLASMSHELRTPLNAIIGFSEMIRDQSLGPDAIDRYRDYANDIHKSGKHLHDLMNDLLDLAKIEAGRIELEIEALDVVEVAGTCLRLVNPAAADKGLRLHLDAPSSPYPALLADRRALRQMLLNLLSNAVKFTPRDGEVTVRIEHVEDGITITVSDTGVGLSEDDQRQLFQPFSRGAHAIASNAEGTGLGLALVKSMMDLHGGVVTATAVNGGGTTFTLRFPPHGGCLRPKPTADRGAVSLSPPTPDRPADAHELSTAASCRSH